MTLVLTVLSILATWALLGALVIALLLILKTLASVRGHLERIGVGVRAIEHELAPLGDHLAGVGPALTAAGEGLDRIARRLGDAATAAGAVDLTALGGRG